MEEKERCGGFRLLSVVCTFDIHRILRFTPPLPLPSLPLPPLLPSPSSPLLPNRFWHQMLISRDNKKLGWRLRTQISFGQRSLEYLLSHADDFFPLILSTNHIHRKYIVVKKTNQYRSQPIRRH